MVGTHALIEATVDFRDLALCVVDEQHRFGVRQRAALDAKAPEGLNPHPLHMTATPIPRTLAITAYGDLDATVLTSCPPGAARSRPTWWTAPGRGRGPTSASGRRSTKGRQCFVVCPLVEESEALQARPRPWRPSASSTEFRDQRVALIHGQMTTARRRR